MGVGRGRECVKPMREQFTQSLIFGKRQGIQANRCVYSVREMPSVGSIHATQTGVSPEPARSRKGVNRMDRVERDLRNNS